MEIVTKVVQINVVIPVRECVKTGVDLIVTPLVQEIVKAVVIHNAMKDVYSRVTLIVKNHVKALVVTLVQMLVQAVWEHVKQPVQILVMEQPDNQIIQI